MKYRVSGQNRETGARITFELDALSRGEAERKAQQAGMDVRRIEEVGDAAGAVADPGPARRGGAGKKMVLFLLLLVVLAAVGFVFKDQIWAVFNQ
jgi:hypothetical protein